MKRSKGHSAVALDEVPRTLAREEDDAIRPGVIVMLPDGGTAAVERIVGSDAYVVEWHKQLGRGPWIFPVSELVLV